MFLTNEKIAAIYNSIIILDIDGTIVFDGDSNIDKDVINLINDLKNKNEVYLFSNSKNNNRNLIISKKINVPIIISNYKKPNKKIIEEINNNYNKKIVVIGDKFLTDGLFCFNIKGSFIKVKRLISGKERIYIKFINLTDDITFKLWKLITKRKF